MNQKNLDLLGKKTHTLFFFEILTSFAAPYVRSTFSSSVVFTLPPRSVVCACRAIEVTLGATESSTKEAEAGAPLPLNDVVPPPPPPPACAAACCASAAASDSAATLSTYDPSTIAAKSSRWGEEHGDHSEPSSAGPCSEQEKRSAAGEPSASEKGTSK